MKAKIIQIIKYEEAGKYLIFASNVMKKNKLDLVEVVIGESNIKLYENLMKKHIIKRIFSNQNGNLIETLPIFLIMFSFRIKRPHNFKEGDIININIQLRKAKKSCQ